MTTDKLVKLSDVEEMVNKEIDICQHGTGEDSLYNLGLLRGLLSSLSSLPIYNVPPKVEWIPVNKLPKSEGSYNVFINGIVTTLYYSSSYGWYDQEGTSYKPTHYMPLPLPTTN